MSPPSLPASILCGSESLFCFSPSLEGIVLGAALAGAAGFHKLATTAKLQLWGPFVTGVKTVEPAIALTYDDGPNPPYTEELLQVLAQHNAKATFFAVGQQLEQYAETARSILDQGHELGNHSYSHAKLIYRRRRFVEQEVTRTDELLRSLGAPEPIHFRAPFGFKRWTLPHVLKRLNKTSVLWNIDPRDYCARSAEEVVEGVVKQVRPGAIVLLHDGGGDRELTIEATNQLIPQLRQQGYQFKTISELLALTQA